MASWEDLAAVVFVSNKFMSSCVICVVIEREIVLLQSDCPEIRKVYNKFKNNNKSGNFTFKCCWWPVGVCPVPSECLSAEICCSWSSDKFAKRVTCEFFFNSTLFLLLVWIRTLRVKADRKIGQFFAGFFHILKRRKTALQLKRRQLCSQVKKMLTSSYLRTGVRK